MGTAKLVCVWLECRGGERRNYGLGLESRAGSRAGFLLCVLSPLGSHFGEALLRLPTDPRAKNLRSRIPKPGNSALREGRTRRNLGVGQ